VAASHLQKGRGAVQTSGPAKGHPHSVCVVVAKDGCADVVQARAFHGPVCEGGGARHHSTLTPIIAFAILHSRNGMCGPAGLLTRPLVNQVIWLTGQWFQTAPRSLICSDEFVRNVSVFQPNIMPLSWPAVAYMLCRPERYGYCPCHDHDDQYCSASC
jgi:hypothetical protein